MVFKFDTMRTDGTPTEFYYVCQHAFRHFCPTGWSRLKGKVIDVDIDLFFSCKIYHLVLLL